MPKEKILVATSSIPSNWASCRTISANLKKSYESLESQFDIQWLTMPTELHDWYLDRFNQISALHEVYLKIKEAKADRLVFIDQVPHPADILSAIQLIDPQFILPSTIVHLYGDFTCFPEKWQKLKKTGFQGKLKFLCASEKQSKLFGNFINSNSINSFPESISTVPFPVDGEDFYFDSKLRDETRSKWGLSAKDKVILYVGRLSIQKNISRLIQEFAQLSSESMDNSFLYIAGAYDDIGAARLGTYSEAGFHFRFISNLIAKLPTNIAEKIVFLGHLNHADLLNAYCGADVLASLSAYHDEDFGMTVAESLSCGLPVIITDWGGYSAFAKPFHDYKRACQLVPIKLAKEGILISSSIFQKQIRVILSETSSKDERAVIRKKFLDQFSVKAVAELIKSQLPLTVKPFLGFNQKLDFLYSGKKNQESCALLPAKDTFYEEVYSAYFTEDSEKLMEWKNEQDLTNWASDYLETGGRCARFQEKGEATELKNVLWPFCEQYTSPAQPIFLFDGWDKSLIATGKRWLARDGIVPLYWFFKSVEPGDFPAQLMVHEDFRAIVPAKWLPHVGYYRVESKQKEIDLDRSTELLLGGLLSPPFVNINELEEQLDLLISRVGKKRIEKMTITAFLPYRTTNFFWDKMHEDLFLSMPLTLIKKLGLNVNPITWNQLETVKTSLKDSLFFEVNKGWIVKDSSFRHRMLAYGAIAIDGPKNESLLGKTSHEEIIELSPFHQLVISSFDPQLVSKEDSAVLNEQMTLQYAKIGNFLFQEKRFNNLWPEWFEALCKTSIYGVENYTPQTSRSFNKA